MQAAIMDLKLEPRTEAAIRNIIGLGLREALQMLYPVLPDGTYASIIERYRYHFFRQEQSQPFSGVNNAMTQLDTMGYLLAVATGKGRKGLDLAMDNVSFGHLFVASRCADEELLEQTGVYPENALMIGDTSYDLEMASYAGMDAAAVCSGVHDKNRLLECKPIVCVDYVPDLIAWLK
jgi:phosphoglycolate phosphatase